jgi:hypothetical protein
MPYGDNADPLPAHDVVETIGKPLQHLAPDSLGVKNRRGFWMLKDLPDRPVHVFDEAQADGPIPTPVPRHGV